jgi:hypothetical protein
MVVEIACEQHHPLILMKGERAMPTALLLQHLRMIAKAASHLHCNSVSPLLLGM